MLTLDPRQLAVLTGSQLIDLLAHDHQAGTTARFSDGQRDWRVFVARVRGRKAQIVLWTERAEPVTYPDGTDSGIRATRPVQYRGPLDRPIGEIVGAKP